MTGLDHLAGHIGLFVEEFQDRNNLRLASKQFRDAHAERRFHSMTLAEGDELVPQRMRALRAIKPRLENLTIELRQWRVLGDDVIDAILAMDVQRVKLQLHLGSLTACANILQKAPVHRNAHPINIQLLPWLFEQEASVTAAVDAIRAARDRGCRFKLTVVLHSDRRFNQLHVNGQVLPVADIVRILLATTATWNYINLDVLDPASGTEVELLVSAGNIPTARFRDIVQRASRIIFETKEDNPRVRDIIDLARSSVDIYVFDVGLFEREACLAGASIKRARVGKVTVGGLAVESTAVVSFVRALVTPPDPVKHLVVVSDSPDYNFRVRIIERHARQAMACSTSTCKLEVLLFEPWGVHTKETDDPGWKALSRLF